MLVQKSFVSFGFRCSLKGVAQSRVIFRCYSVASVVCSTGVFVFNGQFAYPLFSMSFLLHKVQGEMKGTVRGFYRVAFCLGGGGYHSHRFCPTTHGNATGSCGWPRCTCTGRRRATWSCSPQWPRSMQTSSSSTNTSTGAALIPRNVASHDILLPPPHVLSWP